MDGLTTNSASGLNRSSRLGFRRELAGPSRTGPGGAYSGQGLGRRAEGDCGAERLEGQFIAG